MYVPYKQCSYASSVNQFYTSFIRPLFNFFNLYLIIVLNCPFATSTKLHLNRPAYNIKPKIKHYGLIEKALLYFKSIDGQRLFHL